MQPECNVCFKWCPITSQIESYFARTFLSVHTYFHTASVYSSNHSGPFDSERFSIYVSAVKLIASGPRSNDLPLISPQSEPCGRRLRFPLAVVKHVPTIRRTLSPLPPESVCWVAAIKKEIRNEGQICTPRDPINWTDDGAAIIPRRTYCASEIRLLIRSKQIDINLLRLTFCRAVSIDSEWSIAGNRMPVIGLGDMVGDQFRLRLFLT